MSRPTRWDGRFDTASKILRAISKPWAREGNPCRVLRLGQHPRTPQVPHISVLFLLPNVPLSPSRFPTAAPRHRKREPKALWRRSPKSLTGAAERIQLARSGENESGSKGEDGRMRLLLFEYREHHVFVAIVCELLVVGEETPEGRQAFWRDRRDTWCHSRYCW